MGIFMRWRGLEGLGIEDTADGVIRFSLVYCNSFEDVGRLVEGLESLKI